MRLDQARSYAVQQPYISTLHMFLKNRARSQYPERVGISRSPKWSRLMFQGFGFESLAGWKFSYFR